MNPQDLALYRKYVQPKLGESNTLGGLQLAGTLAAGMGAQAINGLGRMQGQDTNIQPPELGKAGIEAVKSIAPMYYDIKNGPIGKAAGWMGDRYGEGVNQDADLVSRYLGPEAGGEVAALGAVAPMAIGPGGEGKAAEEAIAPSVTRALESATAPRDAIHNSTMSALDREGVATKRSAEVEPRSLSTVPAPDSHLAGLIPDDATVFTAKHPETGEVQGFAATVPRNGGHQMLDIHVNPVYRRQGIGRDVYNAAVAHAHEQGMPLFSDTQVSPEQMANVMHTGHSVDFNPTATEGTDIDGDPVLKSGNGQPVYTIHAPTPADDAQPGEHPHGSWIQNQAGEAGFPSGYQAPQELEDFVRNNAPAHRVDPNGPANWEELQASRDEPVMPVNPQSAEHSIYSDTPTNIAFRAWHDKLHLDLNAGFDHDGELKVAQEHLRQAQAAGLSDESQRALWADTWETFKHHEDTGSFPSDPRSFVADKMKQQFPGDGSMLNIGLNQGTEGQPGFRQMHPQEAQDAVESTGAGVTRASLLTPEQHGVSEPTAVISTDRALPEPAMQHILAQTQQSAIPQRTNAGATSMHVAPGHEQIAKEQGWDQFNPEYFRDHDGSTAPAADSDGAPPSEPPPGGMAEGGEVGTALGGLGELMAKYAPSADDHIAAAKAHGDRARDLMQSAGSEKTETAAASNMQARSDHTKAAQAISNGDANADALSKRAVRSSQLAAANEKVAVPPEAPPSAPPPGGMAEGGEVGTALGGLGELMAHYAPEAEPLAEHVANQGGVTYSPTTGALHNTGTVSELDPAATVSLDHPPAAEDIHSFLMDNQDTLSDPSNPGAVMHVTSDGQGNHFMHVGQHEPDMPAQTPHDLVDKYMNDPSWQKNALVSDTAASRPLDEYDRMGSTPIPRTEWTPGTPTVTNAVRTHTPGIYGPTKDVVDQAAAIAAKSPEDPLMKQLFGVTRQDLSDIGMGRQGNLLGQPPDFVGSPGGAESVRNVMNPQNAQRLVDALEYAKTKPELATGMQGWYVMDPAYKRIEQLVGGDTDKAKKLFDQLNTYQAVSSPQTPVDRELQVAGLAHYMQNSGRWNEYERLADAQKHDQEASDLKDQTTHIYHNSQNVPAMNRYNERGVIGSVPMQAPKAYTYGEASNVPDIGNQTRTPVGDTHFAGALGLLDTRTRADPKGSLKTAELQTLAPWFRSQVADRVGMESVPAQAMLWGIFAPQTGVRSGIGMPKLELMTQEIRNLAEKYGVSPEDARDHFLMGTRPARAFAEGGPVLSTLADIVAKYAPDMKPVGNTLYRGTEAGTPGAALRKSSDGEMGPGIYYTQHKWLASSYGGGPKASVKNGTREVHEAEVGPLAPEHVAYAWQPAADAGTGKTTYITSSTGDLLHTYDPLGNGPEAVQSRQAIPGVMQQNGVKVLVGHDSGIAGNQVSVIDPSILKVNQPAAP